MALGKESYVAAIRVCLAVAVFGGSAVVAGGVERFSKAGYWEVADGPRRVTSLNVGWDFSLDAFKSAKRVSLPHCIDEGELGLEASGGSTRCQKAWYRRRFAWTKRSARQHLHFEAVMGKSEVTLNGVPVARHFGGYLPFQVDVTGALRDGDNELTVCCDNRNDPDTPPGRPSEGLDFIYYGGIYRDVWLVETGDAYVSDSDRGGVYVSTKRLDERTWEVRADVTLAGAVDGAAHELVFRGQPVVSPFRVTDPEPWTPETPNLEFLTVNVRKGGQLVDAVRVRFGFRDFTLSYDTGMTLNGRPYGRLLGVNHHQDFAYIGYAMSNSMQWRDVKKFKDAGCNVIRGSHYPQDPAFMDACDELGMFVIDAIPGWNFWNEKSAVFKERICSDIRNMVRRDRSHPCVVVWEAIPNESRFTAEFVTNSCRIVRAECRAPNYCACDRISSGAELCDVMLSGDRWKEKRKPALVREFGDHVLNWSAQWSPTRCKREWGEAAMITQAKFVAREFRERRRLPASGPDGNLGGCYWHGCDHGRFYHANDFWGGILTLDRRRKYSWYAVKCALTDEPFVFLAHTLVPNGPQTFTFFSNCTYRAEWLGKEIGDGSPLDYFSLWRRNKWDKGDPKCKELKLSYAGRDETCRVPGPVNRLVLLLDTEGLDPVRDGSDRVLAVAALADSKGTTLPYCNDDIVFETEGPAEIVGPNPQRTRSGEATVVLRFFPGNEPIRVTARTVRQGCRLGLSATLEAGSGRPAAGTERDDSQLLQETYENQIRFIPSGIR